MAGSEPTSRQPTSRHNSVFKQRLAEHRELLMRQLSQGVAHWDIYNMVIGRLMGLDEALKLADDADYDINNGGS